MSKKIKLKKGEVFKKIEGYGDRYYISNKGRLWSNLSGKFLGSKSKDGYIFTALYNEDGEGEYTSIHREVGKAFVPNDDPENKIEINHKNYIRDDNRAENLEWVTRQENMDYSYERNSESTKKLWKDEDFRKKMIETNSKIMKEKNEDPNYQAKRLEGIKKKWEDPDYRKKMTVEVKKAMCKPLLQYTEEGELVSKFSSGTEASEKTGIKQSSISNALKGRYKTAGGFRWEYDQ